MNPGGENQTESDEEPEEEAEKAYREATMEWVLETLEWVHRENKVQQTLVLVEVKIIVEVRMMNKEK